MFVVRVRLKRDGVAARVCVVRGEIVFEVEDEVVGLRVGLVCVRVGFVPVRLGDELLARRRLGVSRVRRAAEGVGGLGLYQFVVRSEVGEVSRVFVARVFAMLVARLGDRLGRLARRVV